MVGYKPGFWPDDSHSFHFRVSIYNGLIEKSFLTEIKTPKILLGIILNPVISLAINIHAVIEDLGRGSHEVALLTIHIDFFTFHRKGLKKMRSKEINEEYA